MSKDTRQPGLLDDLIVEFEQSLRRDGLNASAPRYARGARHFVLWLENVGGRLADADDAMLRIFARHSCKCAGFADRSWPAPTPRLSAYGAVRFVRFLEARGLVRHPGEVVEGFHLAEAYARSLRVQGFQPSTADTYRRTFTHLVVWLHQCRIPLNRVDADVAASFASHDCLCLGPPWRPPVKPLRGGRRVAARVLRFADFRADGDARAGHPVCQPTPPDPRLAPFRQWLLRERGITECSADVYIRTLRSLLNDIGYDVAQYDAALLRDAVLRQFEGVSWKHAQGLTTAFRAYLRHLASTGQCDAGLLGAVPTARNWALAALPKYLPPEEIERAIATCDPSTAIGVRNRAILLLLARLGLRAGEVSRLRLNDMDWARARLVVSGKYGVFSGLPLPQDVGDALLEYIEHVRPRVEEEKVFLRILGAPRPLDGHTISTVARRALRRAGVRGPGRRGAHAFRHSVATGLVRSGATLDLVGTLLRHRAPASTADLRQGRRCHAEGGGRTVDGGSPMTLRSGAERYIAFKRGQGYKMDSEERLLRRYVSYAEAHGDDVTVAVRMVEWAGAAPSPSTVRTRLSALRCFARWVRAEDERHEVPPNAIGPGQKVRPAPHLLSQADIRQLIDAALSIGPPGSITPHTFHFLFGLMAVTGLRRSEAVALRLGDVTSDGLLVRETKFRKSRLVPLHDSTWCALERYLQLRASAGSGGDHLFVLQNGRPPSPDSVTKTFTDLACQLGLRRGPGKGGGFRLHDLRHCFAVRALERASTASRDGVNRHMLALSTYLGHGDIASTYWYLEATPALMRQVALAAEQRYDGRSAT